MGLGTVFQFYPASIYAKEAKGTLNLKNLVNSIRKPKPEIQSQFELIRQCKDKKEKDKLKESLFMFTPSVMTDGINRGYDNVTAFNPLAVIEWDNLSYEKAVYLKHRIFNDFQSCICAFLSPSVGGVKFIFDIITPTSVDDYKSLWYGLAYFLEQVEPNIDSCNERPTQVLYLSFDKDILFREDSLPWKKRGAKKGAIEVKDYEVDENYVRNDSDIKEVKNVIHNTLNKIVDNGHSIVVKVSCLAGGFVATGYITEEEVVDFLISEIEAHDYLKSKSNTYIKTAKRFVKSGQNIPIKLKKYQNGE